MSRLQYAALSIMALLLVCLTAASLPAKDTKGSRLTILSTTDCIGETSPCG